MDQLKTYRSKLDKIDENLLRLISERNSISKKIQNIKKSEGMPVRDGGRESEMTAALVKKGQALNITEAQIIAIWGAFFAYAEEVYE